VPWKASGFDEWATMVIERTRRFDEDREKKKKEEGVANKGDL